MSNINYAKVFSKLSHIKALTYDQKFDEIIQNLILTTLFLNKSIAPQTPSEVQNLINTIFGLQIRETILVSNIDKLIGKTQIFRDKENRQLKLYDDVKKSLNEKSLKNDNLVNEIKKKWEIDIESFLTKDNLDFDFVWEIINQYFTKILEQHGIQTLSILSNNTNTKEEQISLNLIIEEIVKNNQQLTKEMLIFYVNDFIKNSDDKRTLYLSHLIDATFTSFALTSDEDTISYLNNRFESLNLFLDTNFIFGLLNLHKNNEDASARELIDEIKKNHLPFKLLYHPETLNEFKRTFDLKTLYLTSSNWTKESSRLALEVDGLSPIEELFHSENLETEIDPKVFLEKYDHVDHILKDLNLVEYNPSNYVKEDELYNVENDIQNFEKFYENVPHRKQKSYVSFKHDIVVIREVRRQNPKKSKFLDAKAFFLSSDFILAKFENSYYRKEWEINFVINPSVFLQLLRPFIQSDYESNKKFIDTFSIKEFRLFNIDYSGTRSKALQIMNDNYHSASYETKVKILRDQVLLQKLKDAQDNEEKLIEIVENRFALENQLLDKEIKEIENERVKILDKNDKLESKKSKAEGKILEIKKEKSSLDIELNSTKKDLFEEKIKRIKSENKLKKIEREKFINKKIKKWRQWIFILLFLSIIFFSFSLNISLQNNSYEIPKSIKETIKFESTDDLAIIFISLSSAFFTVFLVFFGIRYINNSAVEAFKKSIEIPIELEDEKTE